VRPEIMLDEGRCTLIPIYENKVDIQSLKLLGDYAHEPFYKAMRG